MKILWRYILLFSLSAFFLVLPLQAMECSRLLSEGLNKDLEKRFLETKYMHVFVDDTNKSSVIKTLTGLRGMSKSEKELLIDYMMDRGLRGLAIVDYGAGNRYGDLDISFINIDLGHPLPLPNSPLPLRIPLTRTGKGSIVEDGRLVASIKLEMELSSLFPIRISVLPEKMPVGFNYEIILNFFQRHQESINTLIEGLNVRDIVIGDLSGHYNGSLNVRDIGIGDLSGYYNISLRDISNRFVVNTSVDHYGYLLFSKEFDYLKRVNTTLHIAVQRKPHGPGFFGRLSRVFRSQSKGDEFEGGVDLKFLEEQILFFRLDRVY